MYAETRYTAEEASKWGDDALKKSNAVAGSKIMGLQVNNEINRLKIKDLGLPFWSKIN